MSNPKYKIDVTHGGNPLGTITIETFPEVAPKHATNFDNLVSEGFYDGTAFHRVIPGFMIQGGDPNSKTKPKNTWGFGDTTQKKVPAEFNSITHSRGIISAARSQDPNSASSQFFLVTSDSKFLDNQYTVYGKVIEGIEIADKIVSVPRDRSDNPDEKVEMTITKLEEIELSNDKVASIENINIPTHCPHCKSPNSKLEQQCQWCDGKIY